MTIAENATAISRRSLHEELVERLQDLIIEGVLASGEKVPEKELCLQFGVSRTPMREALKVLAADGLISLETNRGAWVTSVTMKELEDLFEVMGNLEALAGELACNRITPEQMDAIKATHLKMLAHYEKRDRTPYFHANQVIHDLIVEAADNTALATTHRSMATRIKRARYMANLTEERWKQAVEEHREILDSLERKAGRELGKLLQQHLQNKLNSIHNRSGASGVAIKTPMGVERGNVALHTVTGCNASAARGWSRRGD